MPLLQTFDLGKGEHGWSQRIRIPAFFNKTVSAVSIIIIIIIIIFIEGAQLAKAVFSGALPFSLTTSFLPFNLSFYHSLVNLL